MTVSTLSINRVWLLQFSSGWIGGQGVVVAPDLDAAIEQAQNAVRVSYMPTRSCPTPPVIEARHLREVSLATPSCTIINNGDY